MIICVLSVEAEGDRCCILLSEYIYYFGNLNFPFKETSHIFFIFGKDLHYLISVQTLEARHIFFKKNLFVLYLIIEDSLIVLFVSLFFLLISASLLYTFGILHRKKII